MNPYPWLPDWYYDMYAGTIALFWQYVSGLQSFARERGFDISIVAKTQPQIGSAGTVTFSISCSSLNLSDTRLFDDRLLLSFEGDYQRVLYWWVGTAACARYPSRLGPDYDVSIENWRGKPGRFLDRLKVGVAEQATRKLVL